MVRQRFPSDDDRYTVSFPSGLKERIKETAKDNNRTMNAEIIARLEDSFEPKPGIGAAALVGVIDLALFRVNPVFVCFRYAFVAGNTGEHTGTDLQDDIFNHWQKELLDLGIGDAGEIDLEEMRVEVSAMASLTSDGVNWVCEQSDILSVGRLSGDVVMNEERNVFQAKAKAEDAFFAAVRKHLNDFTAKFHGGDVDITNGHMLDWPRELLKSLGHPLHVHYLSPRPLPKGGLFGR